MKKRDMPDAYVGREQAYIKHTILKEYLQSLFMIIGRGREPVISYVDCFAGPWNSEESNLRDTSISVSLEQMSLCGKALKEKFGRDVKFRALYIEKDEGRFSRLQSYLESCPYPDVEASCLKGNYAELSDDIVRWVGNAFAFFFVDPTGWKDVSEAFMRPLLALERTEFLINLMYDFVNRFVEHPPLHHDMVALFGESPDLSNLPSEERRRRLVRMYMSKINESYKGRGTYVPINAPGSERVKYFLVYLTRSSKGLCVFKEKAQDIEIIQRVTQREVQLRSKAEQTGVFDLFGDTDDVQGADIQDNKEQAKEFLLDRMRGGPVLIDNECWADWLERSDLYPADFQMAMKELVKEGRARNLDADVKRRRKKPIKPDWRSKSERWKLVELE